MTVERIYPREAATPVRRIDEETRATPRRHRPGREELAESQRRRVLRATVEVIGRQGFAETPVADLLAHAGIARKTFYALYSGKEECVLTIYDDATASLRALVERAYEPQGATPKERIDFVVDALFQWVAREPNLARLCIIEAPSSGAAGRKRMLSVMTWLTGVMGDWLGDVDVPELLPELLVGGLHQMMVHRLIIDATDLPPLAAELTEIWLDIERWPAGQASPS
jgi:AcrR family transcriptional regulator